jgi:hypothetical protein
MCPLLAALHNEFGGMVASVAQGSFITAQLHWQAVSPKHLNARVCVRAQTYSRSAAA